MQGMKQRMLSCLLIAVLTLTLAEFPSISAQAAKTVKAKKITLSKKTYTVENGKKIALKATIIPKKTTKKTITWKIRNKKIAVITKKGVVTGKKIGTTTATVTIKGTKKKAICKIKVVKPTIKVASVHLNTSVLSLKSGEEFNLVATVNPSNATKKSITWTSSNPAIATVIDGKVKGIGTGQTVITVSTHDGNKTSTCSVTVSTPAIGMSLPITTSTLLVSQELLLTPTLTPANADHPGFIWTTTNPSVISVSAGVVKALTPGTATITCTSADNKYTTQCVVTVPSTYGVLDIQGFSDGDNNITYYFYDHTTSISALALGGYDTSLSSNFAVKVADGVSYTITNYSGDNKKITLSYKNLTKVYYVTYDCLRSNKRYSNPIVSSISDSGNTLVFQTINHDSSDEKIGSIILHGTNPTLSNHFLLTPKTGYSIKSITEDTNVNTSLAKTIILTKDNIDYTYQLEYYQNNFKAFVISATDGLNPITDISRSDSKLGNEFPLTIAGINPTLSASFALKLAEGATYTLADDPTLTYDKIATVTYGDLKTIYYIDYEQDTRRAHLISFSDPNITIIGTPYINDSGFTKATISINSSTDFLSPQFSAVVDDGCTYTITTPSSGDYERIITVTYGSIQRLYYINVF